MRLQLSCMEHYLLRDINVFWDKSPTSSLLSSIAETRSEHSWLGTGTTHPSQFLKIWIRQQEHYLAPSHWRIELHVIKNYQTMRRTFVLIPHCDRRTPSGIELSPFYGPANVVLFVVPNAPYVCLSSFAFEFVVQSLPMYLFDDLVDGIGCSAVNFVNPRTPFEPTWAALLDNCTLLPISFSTTPRGL